MIIVVVDYILLVAFLKLLDKKENNCKFVQYSSNFILYMQYFSVRLKNARKLHGWSLQELSAHLNHALSKQDLNRLETGIMKPNSSILAMLMNALGVSNDYFHKQHVLPLEEVAFKKLGHFPKKEQETIKAKVAEYLERYLELEHLLGIMPEPSFKVNSFKISSEADIESAAIAMRQLLNLGSDPIYNIHALLEEKGIKVIPMVSPHLFAGLCAQLHQQTLVIAYNNAPNIPKVTKRLAIMHELGHLFLDLSNFEAPQAEKLCDRFAAALLLPQEQLISYFGGKRTTIFIRELKCIKAYYGLSLPAIMLRAKNLTLVSEHCYKYFMIRYNKMYKSAENEGYEGKEESHRFMQLLLRAVAQDVITTTKAAALNNQKLGDFRKDYLDA